MLCILDVSLVKRLRINVIVRWRAGEQIFIMMRTIQLACWQIQRIADNLGTQPPKVL